MEKLIKEIIEWGEDKGINNPKKQFEKLAEEMLEAHEEYVKCEMLDSTSLATELGDIGIVWLLLCNMLDVEPEEALNLAHEKNKYRTGKTVNGDFIKSEDLQDK